MVTSCCAYGCTERHGKDSSVSFHRFPLDPGLRKKWIIATKRKGFQPTNSSRICSKHFTEKDFKITFGKLSLVQEMKKQVPQRRVREAIVKMRESVPVSNVPVDLNVQTEPGPSTSTEVSTHVETIRAHVVVGAKNINSEIEQIKVLKPKRQPVYFGDFREEDVNCKTMAKKMWNLSKKIIEKQRRTIKYLRNQSYRLKKRVKTLTDVINHLKESNKISDNCFSLLQDCIAPLAPNQQQLLLRQLNMKTRRQYPEDLRIFALTLNFYSSSAYDYVRRVFGNCLPHPKTLQKWYPAVDGSPGYTHECLRAVELKVSEMNKLKRKLVVGLIMDEMTIKRHIQWNGKRQIGYVDFGVPTESDSLPEAKDALVFLIVGQNCKWKIPVAYFLINGLTAHEKANLVNGCLTMLHNTGAVVISLTFDGLVSNFAMIRELGASFALPDMKTYFSHPLTNEPIFIFLDACHVIKLLRNALAEWGCLKDADDNYIKWVFFIYLVEIQEESGLHAATNIRRRHLNYKNEIMKVRLAVQTFSNSVADALNFCNYDLEMEKFKDSQHTSAFCRNVNNWFDMMNIRNSLSKQMYKRPLSSHNKPFILKTFHELKEYFSSLRSPDGSNVLESRRKTGFIGLLVNMKSVEGIITHYIEDKHYLDYFLSYKVSQDHLEMFFSNIRSRGGFTNNPTAAQFQSAYKKLLVHTELTTSEAANCLAQDETSILKISSAIKKDCNSHVDFLINGQVRSEETKEDEDDISDIIYIEFGFSDFDNNVIGYVAGFVARKILKSINCNECALALLSEKSFSSLLSRKNKGGLLKPSQDLIFICQVAETIFRQTRMCNNKNIISNMTIEGVRKLQFRQVFTQLNDHILEQDPIQNHFVQLVYLIFNVYFTIRLNHENKKFNEIPTRVRHKFTKLILFRHE